MAYDPMNDSDLLTLFHGPGQLKAALDFWPELCGRLANVPARISPEEARSYRRSICWAYCAELHREFGTAAVMHAFCEGVAAGRITAPRGG